MAEYFECQVRYERAAGNGMVQKVTEAYLVDALSFAEAEARITQEIMPFVSAGELYVVAIKRCNVNEVVIDELGVASRGDAEAQKIMGNNTHASGDADKWYKAKLNFITIDEKTAKEKRQAYYLMVNAGSVQAAQDVVNNHMKGSVQDWTLESIVETKIMDAFFYSQSMQKKMYKRDVCKQVIDGVKALADDCPDGCKMSIITGGKETVIADKRTDKDEGDHEPYDEG